MRILLLHNFFQVRSGSGTGMFQDASILREHGHEVHFFCTDRRPYQEGSYPHTDLFPRFVDYPSLSWRGRLANAFRPFRNREAERKLGRMLERVRPDIVHDHTLGFQLTPALLPVCRKRGIPAVMTIHGAGLFCPAHTLRRGDGRACVRECCLRHTYLHALAHHCLREGWVQRLVTVAVFAHYRRMGYYRGLSAYLCASRAMLELAARAGLPRGRLALVPYGFDRATFAEQPHPGGDYFLFTGRLEREKGVHHLLRALSLLPSPVRLVVAGRGREEEALRRQVARLGLTGVEFRGWVEGAERDALYRGALATVLPCDWFEAFGLTVVESFLHGKPVIASRVGGLPEVVEDGENGLLVVPGDPVGLAAALERLWGDRGSAARMGARGRALAEERYGSDRHHDDLLRVYRSALADAEGG